MENNDKQQIGGYFSTKNASKDEALKGIVAARISASEDVTDKEYTALSNLIRVATSDGCRISLVQETKADQAEYHQQECFSRQERWNIFQSHQEAR